MKIKQTLALSALGVFIALAIGLYLTAPVTDYTFANNGQIMCVTTKDPGLFAGRETKCFGVSPIVKAEDLKANTTNSGEIILKTK